VYTLVDMVGVLVAAAFYVPVLLLPGYAIAWAVDFSGFRTAPQGRRVGLALLVAYAALLILNATLARQFGLTITITVTAALATAGALLWLRDGFARPARRTLGLTAIWSALVIGLWIDIQVGDQLFLSLLSTDMIKRAATTRLLADGGKAPLPDPFFLRNGSATFYYFYFVPAAMVERLGGGLVDPRAAVGGQIIWTGIATVSLVKLLYERTRLARGLADPGPLLLGLMALAGMQILLVALYIVVVGKPLAQTNWINEMVVTWVISLLWVPHHVTGFLVAWTAILALVDADQRRAAGASFTTVAACVLLAAAGFASAFGASTWVTFGLVGGVGVWGILLLRDRRWSTIRLVAAAGLVSLALAAPHILDLLAGRESTKTAVVFEIRRFSLVQILVIQLSAMGIENAWLEPVLRLLTLPINYAFEFGLLAFGAAAFWLREKRKFAHVNDVAVLLSSTAAASLVIGTFFKSDIGNNDLGWRVLLFTQVAALLWTANLLEPTAARMRKRLPKLSDLPATWRTAAIAGLIGVTYDLFNLRMQVPLNMPLPSGDVRNARVDLDTRRAFDWLNKHGDRRWVVQHNPEVYSALGHALYGRNRVSVADRHNGPLLGAEPAVVHNRIDDVAPLFTTETNPGVIRRVAAKHDIDVLLIASTDPIWKSSPKWLSDSPALFTSAHVRLYRIDQVTQ
jgi:uncharacterized membrane protein YvlD (DUF360 family)